MGECAHVQIPFGVFITRIKSGDLCNKIPSFILSALSPLPLTPPSILLSSFSNLASCLHEKYFKMVTEWRWPDLEAKLVLAELCTTSIKVMLDQTVLSFPLTRARQKKKSWRISVDIQLVMLKSHIPCR